MCSLYTGPGAPPYPLATMAAELDGVCPRNRGWNREPTGLPWPPEQNQTQPSLLPWAALCLFQVVAPRHHCCLSLLLACRDFFFICPVHCYILSVENSSRHRRHLLNKWINRVNWQSYLIQTQKLLNMQVNILVTNSHLDTAFRQSKVSISPLLFYHLVDLLAQRMLIPFQPHSVGLIPKLVRKSIFDFFFH